VSEDEMAEVPDPEPVFGEAGPEPVQGARRPAVDQGRLVPFQQVRADDPFAAEVLEVEELHAVRDVTRLSAFPPSLLPDGP
jgi:hypothetical protein